MAEITGDLLVKVVVAGFAAVGIEEWLKNFRPEKKSKWWALIMLPISVGCFVAVHMLPLPVIGLLLVVGTVQIADETLIQGLGTVIDRVSGRVRDGGGCGGWRRNEPPPPSPPPPR